MAVIQNSTLAVDDISATTARVRITYTVLQHPLAYWANSIYREDIHLR